VSIAVWNEGEAGAAADYAAERRTAVAPVDDLPRIFVVPALNEEENLPRLFGDLEARPHLFTERSRVIVVDDGSTDGTAGLVRSYSGPLEVELLPLGRNLGPGAAFRAGFAAALERCEGDGYVVTLEADTTSDLDAVPAMLGCASAGADLVLASVHGGGQMLNVSPLRRFLSAAAGRIVRISLGLDARTVSSFFRVYRTSTLRRAVAHYGDGLIAEPGFACKAELLAKIAAIGAKVEEVPVDLDGSRRIGESKMSLLPTLAGYFRLIVRGRFARGIAST
jgi:dolichol-phosphate mannosyltransferase